MRALKAQMNKLCKEIEELEIKIREREKATDKFIEKWLTSIHRKRHPIDSTELLERQTDYIKYICIHQNIKTYVTVTPEIVYYGHRKNKDTESKVGNFQSYIDIINKIADLCENTDYLDNLPTLITSFIAYTFLLSSPFCRDITKLITKKILFFLPRKKLKFFIVTINEY